MQKNETAGPTTNKNSQNNPQKSIENKNTTRKTHNKSIASDFLGDINLDELFITETKADFTLLSCIDSLKKDNSERYKVDREQRSYDIAVLIHDDLKSRGQFYNCKEETVRQFYFDVLKNKLYDIQSEYYQSLFYWQYDILSTTLLGQSIYSIILGRCFNEGQSIVPRRFSFYDEKRGFLYVYNNDNGVFKIDGETIKNVNNGTDGVFFEDEFDAEKIYPVFKDNDLLNQLFFDTINFDSTEELNYTEQYCLFKEFFSCIFFKEIFPSKPMISFLGPKGAGKTAALQRWVKILKGPLGNVESIPEDVKDFIPLITVSSIIFLDNVDGHIPWLNDMLAKISTGMTITLRMLYKTNVAIRFRPSTFIALTSRSPKFRRDDVADRLLILKVKRFEDFTPQSVLMDQICAARGEIWGDILRELNRRVKALQEKRDLKISSPFRLADFYSFVKKTNKNITDIDTIFQKMSKTQSDYVLESHPFFEFLNIYMPGRFTEEMSTGAWYKMGKETMESQKLDWYRTSRSFGMQLKQIMPEINSYYDAKLTNGKNNVKILSISNKEISREQ